MEDKTNRIEEITKLLSGSMRKLLAEELSDFSLIQEIRIRIGQPLCMLVNGEERMFLQGRKKYIVTKEDIKESMEYISYYSRYAFENELRQGFITVEGGHRVGVAGKVIVEQGKVKNIQYVSSINVRISHECIGCADPVLPFIVNNGRILHTLVIAPPCCGKTTLLRDMIRQVSDGNERLIGCSVGVVDERSELCGCYHGIPQNRVGRRTDVLDCCPKEEGLLMLIRSMAPKVIAVDEIGTAEEIRLIEYAMCCGCTMLASVHAMDLKEARRKPVLGKIIEKQLFNRYIVLSKGEHPGTVFGIYDERGNRLCKKL